MTLPCTFLISQVETDFGLRKVPDKSWNIVNHWIPYPHNAEHHGKADGMHCGQEACSGFRKEKSTSRARKTTWLSAKDSRGRNKFWLCTSVWKMHTTEYNSNWWWNSLCNKASVWCSQDGSQHHSREERLPCNLETGSPCPNNWQWDFHKPQRPPPPPLLFPVLYNICTNGLADLNSNGLFWVHLLTNRFVYKTGSDINTAVITVQEQLEKVSYWCQETESEMNPSEAQALWCTLNNNAVGQAMPAVSFSWEVMECMNSLRYLGIYFIGMLTYKMQVNQQNSDMGERTVCIESHCFKGHWTVSSVPAASECDTLSLTVVWVSQPCHSLSCWSLTGCKMRPCESFWEKQRTHPLRPCATYWTCHPWKQDIRWS